jgi:hypothetical protein
MNRFNTTDPQFIAEVIKERFTEARPSDMWALCLNITGNGYAVGIADANISGWTPTGMYINIPQYSLAEEVIEKANQILFPDRDPEVFFDIQMSSMFNKR